jgi:hypothetical protein
MYTFRWFRWAGLVAAYMGTAPALAQPANFGNITLAPGFPDASGVARGYTQGSFSLSSIANRDRAGNLCLGFADSTPDHILVLEQNFPQLNIQVDSDGGDTTLFIQGPNDRTVRCGDDTGQNTDASLQDSSWQAGQYRIWVGSFDSGVRYDYTLTVRE